jgi:LacI family transcriptional regulator
MATIHDVAKLAGVSVSTVSRVLNGTTLVSDELKARVNHAIQELQYRPSRAARSLRANHSTIIGLLLSDIQNPFFLDLMHGVEDVALKHGYSVVYCNSDENPEKEQQYLDILCDERAAGVIIVPTREKHQNLSRFKENHIPIVAVDRRIKDDSIDAVLVDNKHGAYKAVMHLIENGYRRIGAITGPKTITTGWERLEGYRWALHEAGLLRDPSLERSGPFKVESGRRFAHELLALEPRIDALFLGNNLIAVGALEAIHGYQLRIPDDIALVGYDGMPWVALESVSLTTVIQPAYEMGYTAAQRLFQRLQHPQALSRQEIVLSPTLSIRTSSRPRAGVSS